MPTADRAGKTVACVNDLIRRAIQENKPEGRYAYIAPLFTQAKDIAWNYLKKYAGPLFGDSPNESELRVDLVNGARIRLYGADNPDRLRGIYLDGAVLDEHADMQSAVWTEVVRPALSDRRGWATFIGTPKGKNAFWERWIEASKDPAWLALMLKASKTGLIAADELDDARRQMGEDEYAQEYECSFEAAIKGAFYADELRNMEAEGRIAELALDPAIRVHTAWDLGRADSTAIWFVQCVGNKRLLVDYYESSGVALKHYVDVLYEKKRERKWNYAQHWFPHDIAHRVIDTELSRIQTLGSLGIEAEVVPIHNALDGINATRRMLDRTWLDPVRCERGLEALRQYRREYDERLKDWKSNPLHDWSSHGADALRSFAAGYDDPMGVKVTSDRHRRAGNSPTSSGWAA